MNCKTTLLALSSFAFFSLVVVSCKKSNSGSSSASMSATVGSTNWNPSQTQGIYSSAEGEFDVAGGAITSGDTTLMSVYFVPPATIGMSVSSDTGVVDLQYLDSKSGVLFDGTTYGGHTLVTVTSWDSTNLKIAGTFSGVLYAITVSNDSLVITNGKFNMAYTKQ